MAIVREQDVFLAIGPAVDFLVRRQNTGDRIQGGQGVHGVVTAVAGVAVFALLFLPQLLAYRALNGHFGPSRLVARKMTWTAPHALEVLFSPEHGFFLWTPVAALAIAGLILLAWRGVPGNPESQRIGAIALLMVASQVYVSGSVESWTVAGAFGQRRFVALTILLVLGVATVWRHAAAAPAPARYALAGFAALAIWWNVAMTALFGMGLMDRQRIELRRNAYDAFVTLPRRAPQIVYRYFRDRDSFYRTRAPEEQ
jgi:hypothetical protein